MNKRPSKADIRQLHAQQIADFLSKGGCIKSFDMGATGLVDGKYNTRQIVIEKKPDTSRTPVPEVLATIDARRRSNYKSHSAPKKPTKSRKKVIYDDFGEPLRTVWVDE